MYIHVQVAVVSVAAAVPAVGAVAAVFAHAAVAGAFLHPTGGRWGLHLGSIS